MTDPKGSVPQLEDVYINPSLSINEKELIASTLRKCSAQFNMNVTKPATIPPFVINVNRRKWASGTRGRYVRQISEAKNALEL